jgi:PAS domain-containing protein
LGLAVDPTTQMAGLLLLLWLGGISCVGHKVHRSLGRALGLSLENTRLVADLEGQRRRLEEAEEGLRLSERRFHDFTMTLSASEWLWETDAEHRFVWFSPNVTDLAGTPPPYGKTRREMMAAAADPELIETHWQVLEAHEPFHDVEYVRRDRFGDTWLSASGCRCSTKPAASRAIAVSAATSTIANWSNMSLLI